jgi:hypothetical protein
VNFLTKPRFKVLGFPVTYANLIGFVIGFTVFQFFID